MALISVLVPTYNEEDNVTPLSQAIRQQFEEHLPEYDYEILFIDNDSKDGTRDIIRELCANDRHIKAIFNAKNFGQFSSPYYGILQANGDCVISMCADFQDPPEMIPKYVREWKAGYKIVLGQKTTSKESGIRYAMRNFYYWFMKKNSDVEFIRQVTGSGLYDREFIEVMRSLKDTRPFLRGVVAEYGYKIKLVPYEQQKRRAGQSSNNIFRYYDAAVQSVTSYTKIGVRLAVVTGTVATIVSGLTALGFIVYKLLNWNTFSLTPYALQLVIFFLVSLNIGFVGVVGEYVLDINQRVRERPLVIEAERINF